MGRVDDEQEPDAAIYQKSDPDQSDKRDFINVIRIRNPEQPY